MRQGLFVLIAVTSALAAMNSGCETTREADVNSKEQEKAKALAEARAFVPKPIEEASIHNFYQVTPRIFSGSQPEGAPAFARLKELGVRTIITVDGAAPDVEAARAAGIRYIHLPIGYDGVPAEQATLLAKAMAETEGPVFMHCHHGKHRGPAAVGVCAIAAEGWTNEQAIDWMNKAGTSKDYQGLFDTVGKFRKPDAAALAKAGPLPEKAAVPPMADAMMHVDERWDRMQSAKKTGYKSVPGQPDVEPAHEALLLAELFRELAREPGSAKKGDDFLAKLRQSEAETMKLHESIKKLKATPDSAPLLADVNAAADLVAKSCKACHVKHRN
jgi:protein tyrosine phosphatase (PTP) superfamily phosphohydrolase (DUF442 family)